MGRKAIDLLGKRFGRWSIIGRGIAKNDQIYWLCKCDCGIEKEISGGALRSGESKSCGCYFSDINSEIHKIEFGLSTKRCVYRGYKRNADKNNLQFDLTFEKFLELSQENCHYCGLNPSTTRVSKGNNGDFIYNGLDRKDSTKGYTLNNIVPCCKICNYMKKGLYYKEFVEWINRIKNSTVLNER